MTEQTAIPTSNRRVPTDRPTDSPSRSRDRPPQESRGADKPPDRLTPTIFHEPWWLKTVSGGRCSEATAVADGKTVGRLPYVLSKSFGMASIGMPALTHFLGPAIDCGQGSSATKFLKGVSITRALIDALPTASHIWIKLHRGITDTVAFQESGFTTDVQFTSEITPAPEEDLWRQMRDKTRNVIRRAQENMSTIEEADPDRFIALYTANLRERGMASHYDFSIVRNLVEECLKRRAGRLLTAMNATGISKAGIFTVWDSGSQYYLMATRTADAGNGASSLLIWHAIKDAATRGLVFDFDGARHAKDIRFFAGFGGTSKPRYWVWRSSPTFRVVSHMLAQRRWSRTD